MRTKDVMTREVVTAGPDTSAKHAGELMAKHGFAALPVVDDDNRLLGIVAEADVLRDRIPEDPRLHLRRDLDEPASIVPLLVRGIMTTAVRTASPDDDVADVAHLLVEARLRSLPVVDQGRVVGIVGRRDVLRTLARDDADISRDVLRLIEGYTGDSGCWDVRVEDGLTTVRRTQGAPGVSRAIEEFALERLVRSLPGVVAVHVLAPFSSHGSTVLAPATAEAGKPATVLVVAASRHGATREIAQAIAARLADSPAGLTAVAFPVEHRPDPRRFTAVILGSGVYLGHWLEPARTFATENADALRDRPVWLFSSGPIGTPPFPPAEPYEASTMQELTGALAHHVFPGRLDKELLSFPERAMVTALRAPVGDFRDWAAVQAFADEIAAELASRSEPAVDAR